MESKMNWLRNGDRLRKEEKLQLSKKQKEIIFTKMEKRKAIKTKNMLKSLGMRVMKELNERKGRIQKVI